MSTSNRFITKINKQDEEEGVNALTNESQKDFKKEFIDKLIDLKYKILFKITDIEFYFNTHPEAKTDLMVYGGCLLLMIITVIAIISTTF